MPTEAELLRYIAEREPLAKTCAQFDLERHELQQVLEAAANRAPGGEKLPAAAEPKKPVQAALPLGEKKAPTPGALHKARVYSDGASRGNPGPAGAGAVITDENGKVVEELKRFLGRQTNNVAEYQAAILGLTRARELGVREVELIADSQLLIRQLGGQYQVKHPGIRPLYTEAIALLKTFAKVKLVHVPRELNTAADEMSNRAIDEK
ncbi:MAG: ribonuclease HI family protein [Deltaproteobacteria bacterium]|nr:ribonuclease HI family protein [Deltaproteobacteria bacterium]